MPPRSRCAIASTQRSNKPRSWLTTIAAPGNRESQPSSQSVASKSRWFVGSSNNNKSGSRNKARAKATRMRHPPENSAKGRACAAASKPSPESTAAARAGALSARIAISLSWISATRPGSAAPSASVSNAARSVSAAKTASSRLAAPAGASCATWPMRARAESLISPPSGCNSPTMARSKVDLPAPLRPMRPILRPTSTCRAAPSNKARPPRRMVRSRMVRTVMDAGCGAEGVMRQRGGGGAAPGAPAGVTVLPRTPPGFGAREWVA